ncbi:MAG: zinc ribbon domain-containing protein [Blautia sp.]
MLEYKLDWKGKELVKVDRFFPSSKNCSKCGMIKKELKLSESSEITAVRAEMRWTETEMPQINIREEARRMLAA